MTLILSEEETASLLSMKETVAVLEETFADVARGDAMSDPREDRHAAVALADIAQHFGKSEEEVRREVFEERRAVDAFVEDQAFDQPYLMYLLKTMVGVSRRYQVASIRVNSEILGTPVVNGHRRLVKIPFGPGYRYTAPVLVFSTLTGELLGIVPDAVLQRNRVVATGAIGTRYLARADASVAGVIGSGWMAMGSVVATNVVRPLSLVKVFSPSVEHRGAFADRMSKEMGIDVRPVDSPEAAVAGSDIVIEATNVVSTTEKPVGTVRGDWLEPGMHLDALNLMGPDEECFRRADVTAVTWRGLEGEPWEVRKYVLPNDEAQLDIEQEVMSGRPWDIRKVPEIGEIIIGNKPGRQNPEQISFFFNTSAGVQFAACGARVLELAREQGVGTTIPTDYFLQDHHS